MIRPPRVVALLWGLSVASACGSCAREGILRLDVELRDGPGAFGDREYLVVDLVGGEIDAAVWGAESFATLPNATQFELLTAGSRVTIPFDVVSARIESPISVRVRYCRSPSCGEPDDIAGLASDEPGFRFTIERAVWIGHVSRVRIGVPPIEEEGSRYAAVPGEADRARPYPESGWICRCQVRCDGQDEADIEMEFGACIGTRARCDETAPHPCD